MSPRLLQPTSSNYDTGGYLYNAKLARRGCVQLETVAAEAFTDAPVEPGEVVLVDSLFLSVDPSSVSWLDVGQPLALVHHLSCLMQDPVDPEAREIEWLRRVRGIIVTSFFMARRVRELVPDVPVEVCRPGLDPMHVAVARTRAHQPPRILSVGHVVERKGYLEAAEALAAAVGQDPGPWRWRVIGDDRFEPGYARRFREHVERLGLGSRLEFSGPTSPEETARAYPEADVFLLPSSFEAFGMVYIEALAAGLPVVAFDAGEVAALVPPGHGSVCPCGDVGALGDALVTWIRWARGGAILAPVVAPGWDEVAQEFEGALARLTRILEQP